MCGYNPFVKRTQRMRGCGEKGYPPPHGVLKYLPFTDRTLVNQLQGQQSLLKSFFVCVLHSTLQLLIRRSLDHGISQWAERVCPPSDRFHSETSDLGGVGVCSSSCFSEWLFWTGACLSACQWDVWCRSAFCDGWLQCAIQSRGAVVGEGWGPGLFPVGFHMAAALVCLRYPALPWHTHIGSRTPKSGHALPPQLCATFLFSFSAGDKDKTTSALQSDRGRETKEVKTQILIQSPRPEPVLACVCVHMTPCLVCRCLCYTTVTHLYRQPKRKQFFYHRNNNRHERFYL